MDGLHFTGQHITEGDFLNLVFVACVIFYSSMDDIHIYTIFGCTKNVVFDYMHIYTQVFPLLNHSKLTFSF